MIHTILWQYVHASYLGQRYHAFYVVRPLAFQDERVNSLCGRIRDRDLGASFRALITPATPIIPPITEPICRACYTWARLENGTLGDEPHPNSVGIAHEL